MNKQIKYLLFLLFVWAECIHDYNGAKSGDSILPLSKFKISPFD